MTIFLFLLLVGVLLVTAMGTRLPLPDGENYIHLDKRATDDILQSKYIKFDITALADFSLYKKFLETAADYTGQDTETVVIEQLKRYMAANIRAASNILSTLNLGVGLRIELLVQAVRVFTSVVDQGNLTVQNFSDSGPELLRKLSQWKATNMPHSTDIVILFTGVNLVQGGIDGIRGITQNSAVCETYAAAVVEYDVFHTQFHVAHELGHMLGAPHTPSTCSDGTLMVGVTSPYKTAKDYKFSSCSVDRIKSYLSTYFKPHEDCMLNSFPPEDDVPKFSEYPGADMNPDEQCQMINGPGSFFCRDLINDGSEICTKNTLQCWSSLDYTCKAILAMPLPGTPCGSNQCCYQSQCIRNPNITSETCPYGDQTIGIDPDNELSSCEDFISDQPRYCYGYSTQCCEICKRFEGPDPECPYGNQIDTCKPDLCGTTIYRRPYNTTCCATCKA